MKSLNDLLKIRTHASKDLIIIIIISVVVLSLAVSFDLFDRFVYWYIKYEEPEELEEFIVVVLVLSFAFAIFSWRRWRDLIIESNKRMETEELLLKERDMLQKALDEIKTLRGIVPICSSCKKIRNDKGYWQQVEVYVSANSEAEFSHGICPDCMKRLYHGFEVDEATETKV
jgi:hypothetical protein